MGTRRPKVSATKRLQGRAGGAPVTPQGSGSRRDAVLASDGGESWMHFWFAAPAHAAAGPVVSAALAQPGRAFLLREWGHKRSHRVTSPVEQPPH